MPCCLFLRACLHRPLLPSSLCSAQADTLRGRVIRQSSPPLPLFSSLRPLKECCNFLNCFYESTRCSSLPSAPLAYFPLPPAAALHNSNTACQSISHLACSETKVSLALLLTLSQQLTLQHGCEKEERGNRRRRGPTFARVVNLSVGGYLFCALLIQIRSNLRRRGSCFFRLGESAVGNWARMGVL